MVKITLATVLVLALINIIPIIVYGLLSSVWGLKTPMGASPWVFLLSVFVTKIGTATVFVLIFYLARNTFGNNWLLYAFLWLIMFVFGEIGQTIVPTYSWKEALAGIISETIYLPLSAYIVHLLLE